jgi:hypothetical protein
MLDLVERRVDGFGRYRFGSVGESSCGRCHVDNVARARSLHLRHGDIFVSRTPIAHELDRCRAIVCYRSCEVLVVALFMRSASQMFTYVWVAAGHRRTGGGGIHGPWWRTPAIRKAYEFDMEGAHFGHDLGSLSRQQ